MKGQGGELENRRAQALQGSNPWPSAKIHNDLHDLAARTCGPFFYVERGGSVQIVARGNVGSKGVRLRGSRDGQLPDPLPGRLDLRDDPLPGIAERWRAPIIGCGGVTALGRRAQYLPP